VGLILCAAVAVAAPPVGVGVSVLFLGRAFKDTDGADPSQKARVLADGISQAMNGAAGGLIVSLAAVVAALAFAVRLVRERRAARARGDQRGSP